MRRGGRAEGWTYGGVDVRRADARRAAVIDGWRPRTGMRPECERWRGAPAGRGTSGLGGTGPSRFAGPPGGPVDLRTGDGRCAGGHVRAGNAGAGIGPAGGSVRSGSDSRCSKGARSRGVDGARVRPYDDSSVRRRMVTVVSLPTGGVPGAPPGARATSHAVGFRPPNPDRRSSAAGARGAARRERRPEVPTGSTDRERAARNPRSPRAARTRIGCGRDDRPRRAPAVRKHDAA